MSTNRQFSKYTAVKIVFTLITLMTSAVWAQSQSSNNSSNSNSSNNNSSSSNNNNNNNSGNWDNSRYVCKEYQDDLRDAKNDLTKLCRDAGAGGGCAEKVASCSSAAGADGSLNLYSTAATAVGSDNALGTALGVMGQSGGGGNGCPQYTFQDYFSKKDKYTDDLDKTEEDLAALSDEKAEVQEDFNKEIADLQEDLNKAQEDLQQKKRDLADQKRDRIAEFQKAQNDSKDSLDELGTQLLDLRGKVISAQRDKALQLISLTEASAKRGCLKAVSDQKAQMAKDSSLSGLSSGTMISKAKRQKQDLIAIWNDCMTVYEQKRQALLESKKQEEETLDNEIKKVQDKMTRVQDSLDLAGSQMTEIQNQATTEEQEAEQNLTKLMQNIQNKMTAAKQKLEQKLQTIATKTTQYGEKINRLSTQISRLGVEPPSGTTTTATAISGEMADKQEQIEELQSWVDSACGSMKNNRGNSSQQGGRS
ncbi:hypothetical protein [Bdellovibrio sp. GT3]|uniref:hypothetical protein n=1 Tax=Bdellovibrio sp. GT3 TaxID=3136282 RepID=UPI0030F1D62B